MIYLVTTPTFRSFMSTGRRTPSTEEVVDAINAIKARYPKLAATDVSACDAGTSYARTNSIRKT